MLFDAPQVGIDAGTRELLDRITNLETRLAEISAAAASNDSQVDFLAGQTLSAEASPGSSTTITTNPATSSVPQTWLPFNAAADASRTVTTSSTGKLEVQAGGFIFVQSINACTQYGFIGVEILSADGTVQVRAPGNGDGNFATIQGPPTVGVAITNTSSGQRHEWTLSPNTTYVLRCRRGYRVDAGSTGAIGVVSFQGTALSVTKIGM